MAKKKRAALKVDDAARDRTTAELAAPSAPASGPLKAAYRTIEDDVVLVRAAAGVLHLAFKSLDDDGEGGGALAQSLFSAAKSIEAACGRIEDILAP